MITIKDEHILLDQTYNNAEAAIVAAGEFLVGHGLVSPPYIDSIQVPDGVNFGSSKEPQIATILFVVALKEKQLEALQDIAFFCSDIENVMALSDAKDLQAVQTILQIS